MSRVGKAPIAITAGVTVTVSADNVVTVKGPKGELQQAVDADITVEQEEGNSYWLNVHLIKNAIKHYTVYTVR
jgi:ribosomal protein L6P/L9E